LVAASQEVQTAKSNFWPSNLTAGNWKVGVVVDDAASDEQTQTLDGFFPARREEPSANLPSS
jgi:hypothetical protein